jgi:hypothetical protein
MKLSQIFFYWMIFCISTLYGEIHPSWRERHQEMITEAKKNPTEENIIEVLDKLRSCYRYMDHNNPTDVAMYQELKQGAIELPNHSVYLTQQIETERAKVADHPFHSGTRGQFNRLRGTIIEDTLCHLPSPETVAALGNYLFDERDTPPPMFPGQDWIDVESNAYLACKALGKIGLRHSPGLPPAYEQEENLAAWRLWWKDVEAGRRAISFEGEKVEYWLREKGTWETAAWKNEHRTREASSADMQDEHKRTSHSLRWLLVLGGALLGILWLRWKKQRAASS